MRTDFPRPFAGSKPKILVLALLAAALLMSAVASPALAGGGGVGAGGTSTSGGKHKSHKAHAANSHKYVRLWHKVSRKNKRWASRTAECESGKDPKAIGGGGRYRGAFQFMKTTWRNSPHSPGGDPIRYAYKTQAVVAVGLMKKQGRNAWPVCG